MPLLLSMQELAGAVASPVGWAAWGRGMTSGTAPSCSSPQTKQVTHEAATNGTTGPTDPPSVPAASAFIPKIRQSTTRATTGKPAKPHAASSASGHEDPGGKKPKAHSGSAQYLRLRTSEQAPSGVTGVGMMSPPRATQAAAAGGAWASGAAEVMSPPRGAGSSPLLSVMGMMSPPRRTAAGEAAAVSGAGHPVDGMLSPGRGMAAAGPAGVAAGLASLRGMVSPRSGYSSSSREQNRYVPPSPRLFSSFD